jgi:hypothetical protein
MHLTLTPQAGLPGEPETTIQVRGDVLTVDGTAYDLSEVPKGGEGWPEGDGHPFVGPVTRKGGVLAATIVVRLGDTAAHDQPDSPWVVPDARGKVKIPAARKTETLA